MIRVNTVLSILYATFQFFLNIYQIFSVYGIHSTGLFSVKWWLSSMAWVAWGLLIDFVVVEKLKILESLLLIYGETFKLGRYKGNF